ITCVGGVRRDISSALAGEVAAQVKAIERTFRDRRELLLGTNSFIDRLMTTGRLSREAAVTFGAVGPVARGSGVAVDVRADQPYAAYTGLGLTPVTHEDGDAMARIVVRLDEIEVSFRLIRQLLGNLPAGPIAAAPNGSGAVPGQAFGWAESAKGELLYWLRLNPEGGIERCKVRSASFANWPLFAIASAGTVLTDFAFTEHSFGLSQAGCDL
ncbi:MAG: NADH-quinone oxidoreductase subunit D-related protein, partial [Chloroflexota bacterium]